MNPPSSQAHVREKMGQHLLPNLGSSCQNPRHTGSESAGVAYFYSLFPIPYSLFPIPWSLVPLTPSSFGPASGTEWLLRGVRP